MKQTKKKMITAILASALIASAALPTVAYADNEITKLLTDSPVSYGILVGDTGEWEITSEGIDAFAGKTFDYISDIVLHIGLKEDYNDSMVIGFRFLAGEKTYEINYILMKAEQHMDIPIMEITNALKDQYPDEEIPFDKIESGVISDGAGLIDELYITGTFDTPSLAGSVWEVHTDREGNGEYTTHEAFWVFNSDGKSGRMFDAKMNMGIAFDYEQVGKDLVLHLGSADDNTPAKFEITEDGVFMTVNYGDEGQFPETMKMYICPGEDPDTFGVTEETVKDAENAASAENTNPKTGVGIGFSAMLAAGAAMLSVISRKRR